jgi:hypothetical protein
MTRVPTSSHAVCIANETPSVQTDATCFGKRRPVFRGLSTIGASG